MSGHQGSKYPQRVVDSALFDLDTYPQESLDDIASRHGITRQTLVNWRDQDMNSEARKARTLAKGWNRAIPPQTSLIAAGREVYLNMLGDPAFTEDLVKYFKDEFEIHTS